MARGLEGKTVPASTVRHMRGHKLTPTCVVLSPDDTTAFSGSKDNSILRWDVETGKRVTMLPHWRKLPGGKVPAVKAHSREVSAESGADMLFACTCSYVLSYLFFRVFSTYLFLHAFIGEMLRGRLGKASRSVASSKVYTVRYVC